MEFWMIFKRKNSDAYNQQFDTIQNELNKYNIKLKYVYLETLKITTQSGNQILYENNKQLKKLPDVAYLATCNYQLMMFLENNGVKIFNSIYGTICCKDKYLSHQIASSIGLDQPKTIYIRTPLKTDYQFICDKLGTLLL